MSKRISKNYTQIPTQQLIYMYQKQIPKITHNLQHNNSSVCTKNIRKLYTKSPAQ